MAEFVMKLLIGKLWSYTGWFLAACLACLVLPRVYNRVFLNLPSFQQEQWIRIMAQKHSELASPWHDTRPLILIAGDSQIELGDWYELFGGAFAIRNSGLSRAKIEDVVSLISGVGDPSPKMVVLMCGVNNLGAKVPVSECLAKYEQLLSRVNVLAHPQHLLVLSVMPVRETSPDRSSHEFNRQISVFNGELATLCQRYNAEFVDVNPAVMDSRGGLAAELTIDGLHLNREGYKKIAEILAPKLAEINQPPVHEKH
jgi:lysophospholipase L1-like esterase